MSKKTEHPNNTEHVDTFEKLAAYRIKRLERQAELMKKMTTKPDPAGIHDALFCGYPLLLTVSAIIGYTRNNFIDIKEGPQTESVQRQFFQNDQLKIIDLIAYAHTRNPLVIRQVKKFDIFSGYAAGGFDIMCRLLDAQNRNWSDPKDVVDCANIIAEWYAKGSKGIITADNVALASLINV